MRGQAIRLFRIGEQSRPTAAGLVDEPQLGAHWCPCDGRAERPPALSAVRRELEDLDVVQPGRHRRLRHLGGGSLDPRGRLEAVVPNDRREVGKRPRRVEGPVERLDPGLEPHYGSLVSAHRTAPKNARTRSSESGTLIRRRSGSKISPWSSRPRATSKASCEAPSGASVARTLAARSGEEMA